jgi:hypothetical protein
MGCGCKKNNPQHRVVNEDGQEVFRGPEVTANAVAKRYPNSKVEPVEKAPAKK